MPAAQEARLKTALQEYISSYSGDGGGPARPGVDPGKSGLVSKAQSLLDALSSQGTKKSESPGSRTARSAGSEGASERLANLKS